MLLWSAIAAALLLWAPQVLSQSTCPILGCATGQCTTLTVDLTQNWVSKRNDTQMLGWGRPRSRGGFGRAGPWGRKLLRSGFGWGWGWAASVNVWSCNACDSDASYKAVSGPYNTTSCICQDGFGRKDISSTSCEPCGEGSVPLGPLSGVVLRSNRTTWPPTLYYTLGNSSATNYPWKRGNHGYSFQQCVKCPGGSSTANGITCVAGASSNSSSSSLPTATSKDNLIVLIPVAMHAGTMPEVIVSSETDPQLAASISAALNAEAANPASDAAAAVATDTSIVATAAAAEDSTGQGQGDATAATAVQPASMDATAAAVAAMAAAGDSTGQDQDDAAAAAAVLPAFVDATAAAVAATEAAAADGNTIAAEDEAVPPGGP